MDAGGKGRCWMEAGIWSIFVWASEWREGQVQNIWSQLQGSTFGALIMGNEQEEMKSAIKIDFSTISVVYPSSGKLPAWFMWTLVDTWLSHPFMGRWFSLHTGHHGLGHPSCWILLPSLADGKAGCDKLSRTLSKKAPWNRNTIPPSPCLASFLLVLFSHLPSLVLRRWRPMFLQGDETSD